MAHMRDLPANCELYYRHLQRRPAVPDRWITDDGLGARNPYSPHRSFQFGEPAFAANGLQALAVRFARDAMRRMRRP